jgi:hypothetical protein
MESLRTEVATATGELGREKQNVASAVLIAGNKNGKDDLDTQRREIRSYHVLKQVSCLKERMGSRI